MKKGDTVWTTKTIHVPDSKLDFPYLGVLTKGIFEEKLSNGKAKVWFGEKIGYVELDPGKITDDIER